MNKKYRLILSVILIYLLLLASVAWSEVLPATQPEKVGLSSQRLDRIDQALQAHIKEGKVPGAVVLVARKGKIAYLKSFGMRDKEAGTPMTKDAIFRLYSMSKPVVSVGAMMLVEEGRLRLSDPVAKYLPEFGNVGVAVEGIDSKTSNKTFTTEPAKRKMTIQDLMRHTSGLTYDWGAPSQVKEMYQKADIRNPNQSLAEQISNLAKLPLAFQPGTRWEYSFSTDVLGRVIEVVSGMTLDRYVEEKICGPLRMTDTGFYVKPENMSRLAEGQVDPKTGKKIPMIDVTKPPKLLSGGGGMVGSILDYARFSQMLLNGGALGKTRLVGRKTVELMTADHLGNIPGMPAPGYGMGLGFGVRLQDGIVPRHGTAGLYYWNGLAGTHFWVDPKEKLIGIIMVQDMILGPPNYYRDVVRPLVYQAIID